MRVQFVLSEVWIGLRRNLTMTIALVVVVAISLSLLGTGLLFVKQVDKTRSVWQSKVELSIYLCTSDSLEGQCAKTGQVSQSEIDSIQSELRSSGYVTSDVYVNQAQAYQQFKSELRGDQPILQYTSPSEIPPSLEIRLKNTQADAPIVTNMIGGAPGVADVVDDSAILNNFYRLLDGARNAVVIIALFLLVAAILLVANTIRLSAFNRRRETSIMRLVGASNFYVQLPFLAEGMIAGLVGWLVASGLLIAVKSLWLNGLQSYIPFGGTLTTTDLIEVVVIALITGLLICGSTSFLTLRRYLRV
jgi:cell division transport system permease protein